MGATIDLFKGRIKFASGPDLVKLMLGITATEVLDSSSADATAATITNGRAISVDADGIIKFDYVDDSGNTTTEVKQVTAGAIYPYRNVTKAYRYYVDTTACTAKAYTTAGALTVGLKIHR